MLTPGIPRRKRLLPGYTTFNLGREHTNSYMYDDTLKAKEKQIDILTGKLNQCENLIQANMKEFKNWKKFWKSFNHKDSL